jgi:UDP-galactopyranose mutase
VVHTVNLGIRGPDLPPYHWVYYPTDETIFHRLSFPHLFSSRMVPEGCQSIMCEISESGHRPRNRDTLIEDCVADLKKVDILQPEHEILHQSVTTLDPAYIIYDLKHRDTVDRLHKACNEAGIFPCGRFGDWEYLNMDHSIMSGKRIAEEIAARLKS